MKSLNDLEQRVYKSEGRDKSKFYFALIGFMAIGFITIYSGYQIYNGSDLLVSADEITTPPVPPEPAPSGTPVSPSDPDEDFEKTEWEKTPGNIYAKKGWSMVSGTKLAGYDLLTLEEKKVILYSFNDPHFPIREWVTYPVAEADKVKYNSVIATEPLGYYLYNPGNSVKMTLAKLSTIAENEKIYARGWHLIHWSGETTSAKEIFKNLRIEYSDGTQSTFLELVKNGNHKVSDRVYVVTNEESLVSQEATEMISVSGDSNLIPNDSYIWIYFRRSVSRVIDMNFITQ